MDFFFYIKTCHSTVMLVFNSVTLVLVFDLHHTISDFLVSIVCKITDRPGYYLASCLTCQTTCLFTLVS